MRSRLLRRSQQGMLGEASLRPEGREARRWQGWEDHEPKGLLCSEAPPHPPGW